MTMNRLLDKFSRFVAEWLLPRRVVYFAAMRLFVNATVGKYSNQIIPELTAIQALDRWRETK
jgi:hypothetical protein